MVRRSVATCALAARSQIVLEGLQRPIHRIEFTGACPKMANRSPGRHSVPSASAILASIAQAISATPALIAMISGTYVELAVWLKYIHGYAVQLDETAPGLKATAGQSFRLKAIAAALGWNGLPLKLIRSMAGVPYCEVDPDLGPWIAEVKV
jgi:hypothetical protein